MKKYIIMLFVIVFATSCYREEDFSFEKLQSQEIIIDIETTKEALIANSIDTMQIHVIVPENADNELAEVSVTTLLGNFLNGEKKVSGQPKVGLLNGSKKKFFTAILKSSTEVGENKIEVEVAEVNRYVSFRFNTSLPSAIEITPSSLALASGFSTELDVLVSLNAALGKVSNSYPFTLSAMDTLNQPIGTFRVKSEKCASNACTSKYSIAPDTAYVGIVRFFVETVGVNGSIQDSVDIYITK
jgi:hypothetical protein